ncbi:SH3 domain-containing protein, partial [Duncaniella sp.]|uniref:SH3 domain-containing protein n=1 Tax=Duncaniella sp. TaxID=2518496 RepID=UPI0023D48AED
MQRSRRNYNSQCRQAIFNLSSQQIGFFELYTCIDSIITLFSCLHFNIITKNSLLCNKFLFAMHLFRTLFAILLVALSVFPLKAQNQNWAQVRIPVACIRDGKSHASEMTSQVIMGTPLLILEDDDEWIKIKAPDGYEGYINISGLSRKSESQLSEWRSSARLVVTSRTEAKVYSSPSEPSARNVISELVLSSIVEGKMNDGPFCEVVLPDGRKGYVASGDVIPAEQWASRSLDVDSILETAYWLMGAPYLWGACSTKSVDCSGLVRVAYFDR